MSLDDLKKFVYITAFLTIGVFTLLVWWIDDLHLGIQTFQKIPTAVTVTFIFWLFFTKWGWKWWPLCYLFDRPYLAGTWIGHIESNWKDMESPIPIVFTIRQNFFSLIVQSFTQNREGLSDVANITIKKEEEIIYLSYIYALREEFKAGMGNQQGAAELRVIGKRKKELRGEYWTNTQTRGRIILQWLSKNPVYSYNEATEKLSIEDWPTFSE